MATIELTTELQAPIERCFDASRDLDLHMASMAETGERAVAGKTSGLIGPGEQVTWEARHLGVRQRFTSQITAFSRPTYFQDTMQKGAFKAFVHDHRFEEQSGRTIMKDRVTFQSPLGWIGQFVDWLFMSWYLRRLIEARNQTIRAALEQPPSPEP